MTERRAFGSTYRLQLNGLGFAAATSLVPFLAELGVATLYLSPVTRARSGSTHGYDVADPTVIDPELGGRDDFDRLLDAAASHDMSVLLDIVPNHMAASVDNPYFRDVLQRGEQSKFAAYFDIAWDEQDGRIMLPVLGQPLAEVIAAGELEIVASDDGDKELAYFEQRFPIDPTTCEADLTVAELHDRQHYVLADWRRANQELNYRRFFDINELIGVRQEDPAVFAATHQLILELAADPRIAGVRVDHVDGLRDPAGYLEELRRALGPDPLIEVEKILEREESLRDWPIDGTSGYEFAVAVTGLFIDPAGAAALAAAHGRATGDSRSFNDRATEAKRMVIASRFPHLVAQIAEELQRGDVTTRRDVLEAAIAELAVQLTVYRTYVTAAVDANDHALLTAAAQHARASLPASEAAVVTEVVTAFTAANRSAAATEGLARWQQLTPPATAKGVEDTAIYEPGQLLAAADVGSDPDRPAVAAAEFHSRMADRQRHWPQAMSTLSTHDSKRSHDARCRLAVLSELPQQWQATIDAIEAVIAPSVGAAGPDAVERRYLYESLVAVWPLSGSVDEAFVTRIRDHMVKAGREAKRRSDWIKPDLDHETAVGAFIESLLQDGEDGARRHLTAMVDEVALAGATNSLASVVVRAAAPGVPDVYQGDDAWLLTLVDPDNRGAVDSAAHAAMLRSLPTAPGEVELSDLLQSWRDGRIKQFVVQRSLRARRDMTEFFATADYAPIEVVGEHRDRLFAFARRTAEHSVVCVVPRLARSIAADFPVGASVWRDTGLVLGPYAEDWVDHISGHEHATDGVVPVGSVLALLPVALLSAKRVAR